MDNQNINGIGSLPNIQPQKKSRKKMIIIGAMAVVVIAVAVVFAIV